MTVAITGHRPSKLDNDYGLTSPLTYWIKDEIIKVLKTESAPKLITGMALGVDTLFAHIGATEEIPYTAAIPFIGQDRVWPIKSRKVYLHYLKLASSIYIVNQDLYMNYAMFHELYTREDTEYSRSEIIKFLDDRNKWMIDNCDRLIAVYDGTKGGTDNAVRYAMSTGVNKPTTIINPHTGRKLLNNKEATSSTS